MRGLVPDCSERSPRFTPGQVKKELALEQLETLAAQNPGLDYGDLKLDPDWDSLRSDPRFDALVAQNYLQKQRVQL